MLTWMKQHYLAILSYLCSVGSFILWNYYSGIHWAPHRAVNFLGRFGHDLDQLLMASSVLALLALVLGVIGCILRRQVKYAPEEMAITAAIVAFIGSMARC